MSKVQSNIQLLYTVLMMAIITLVALFLNFLILLPSYTADVLFYANDVKSVATYHNDKAYYLSFKEQKHLLELLNQGTASEEIAPSLSPAHSIPIQKLVVNRFDHPKITLTPAGVIDDKIVFNVAGLEKTNYITEKNVQEIASLLNETFDK